jgi:predicted metal-binding membrane protein
VATRQKLVASVLVAVPAVALLALAIGEVAEGEASGAQHVPEAAALLALAAAGWRYPRVAGAALLGGSALLLLAWLVLIVGRDEPGAGPPLLVWIGVAAVLFAPPALAGWLLLRAARSVRATK